MDSEPEFGDDNLIFSLDVKHRTTSYKFDGYELAFGGHRYQQDVESYLPQPPLLTKPGKGASRQSRPLEKKSTTWWKAQCLFRGLDGKGTITQLQDRLKGHEKDALVNELQELQTHSEAVFKAKNKVAREHRWLHDMTDFQKAQYNMKRFLKEKFFVGEKSKDVVVIEARDPAYTKSIATPLGLECETIEHPVQRNEWNIGHSNLAVVGHDKSAVTEKIRTITKEFQLIEQEIKAKAAERSILVKRQEEYKQKILDEALAKCPDWDVEGTWEISFPYIEKNWDINKGYREKQKLTLKIYLEETSKGARMFAKFNFGILKGLFQFERQPDDTPLARSKKRKADELEEPDTHEKYSDSDDRRSKTPEAFYFGHITKPSEGYATWNYRWRDAAGKGHEVDNQADGKAYSITFFGPDVRTLKGTMGSVYFDECEFTGVKVGVGRQEYVDIGNEWGQKIL